MYVSGEGDPVRFHHLVVFHEVRLAKHFPCLAGLSKVSKVGVWLVFLLVCPHCLGFPDVYTTCFIPNWPTLGTHSALATFGVFGVSFARYLWEGTHIYHASAGDFFPKICMATLRTTWE